MGGEQKKRQGNFNCYVFYCKWHRKVSHAWAARSWGCSQFDVDIQLVWAKGYTTASLQLLNLTLLLGNLLIWKCLSTQEAQAGQSAWQKLASSDCGCPSGSDIEEETGFHRSREAKKNGKNEWTQDEGLSVFDYSLTILSREEFITVKNQPKTKT